MTEREYYRETDAPASGRREVYQETVVDGTPAIYPDHSIYHERAIGPDGEQVLRSEHVSVPSPAAIQSAKVARARQVVYFIFGVISVLLVLRFVLLLLGANPGSPFVALIYGLSRPFVMPFAGIFGEPSFAGSVIEWSSLVGIVIYSLLAYGITRLIAMIYTPLRPGAAPER